MKSKIIKLLIALVVVGVPGAQANAQTQADNSGALCVSFSPAITNACASASIVTKHSKRHGPIARIAATLYQAECRETLRGIPSGNDNEWASAERAITVNYGGWNEGWIWRYYNRYDDWHMRQDIGYYRNGWTFEAKIDRNARMYCNDNNHSGQIGSEEDEWTIIVDWQ